MRFLVALILGLGVLFGLNVFVDFFSMERPWGSIFMGLTVGLTMLVVLLVWEAVRPTHNRAEAEKSQRTEEERARARAQRRARLAAEAGVSLEGIDSALPGSTASDATEVKLESGADDQTAEAAGEDEAQEQSRDDSPEADEKSSIESSGSEAKSDDDEQLPARPATRPVFPEQSADTPADATEQSATGREGTSEPADTSAAEEQTDADSAAAETLTSAAEGASSHEAEAGDAEAGDVAVDETDDAVVDGSEAADVEARSPGADAAAADSAAAEESATDIPAQEDPETLAPGAFDETASGSSLENPPTGEPGMSVDALEGVDSPSEDAEAHDDSELLPKKPRTSPEENSQYRL